MADTLDDALKQLSAVSSSLNQASDKLSQHLAEVETSIGTYKLGVSVWIDLRKEKQWSDPGTDGRCYEWTAVDLLGYGKLKGKWGLLVASYCEETFEGDAKECFLRDAPRDTRLAAVEKLPDLIKALTKEAAKVAEDATKKAERTRQIAAGLGKKSR